MSGTARKIRGVRKMNGEVYWYRGSMLVEVDPPMEVKVGGFLTETRYLFVGVTPEAVDHRQPETTLFAANKDATLFGGFEEPPPEPGEEPTWVPQFEDRDDGEVEFGGRYRVVGEKNPAAALRLAGYELEEAR